MSWWFLVVLTGMTLSLWRTWCSLWDASVMRVMTACLHSVMLLLPPLPYEDCTFIHKSSALYVHEARWPRHAHSRPYTISYSQLVSSILTRNDYHCWTWKLFYDKECWNAERYIPRRGATTIVPLLKYCTVIGCTPPSLVLLVEQLCSVAAFLHIAKHWTSHVCHCTHIMALRHARGDGFCIVKQ